MHATLREDTASAFAALALRNVEREYPHVFVHVLTGPEPPETPRCVHPIFFGCYDWHSCVHGYWLLARLLRRFPELDIAGQIVRQLEHAITPEAVSGEIAFFNRPGCSNFERTYGWVWLLKLAAELQTHPSASAKRCGLTLAPLERLLAGRLTDFLRNAPFPIRAGTHSNSAFTLALAHEYATTLGDAPMLDVIRHRAREWFGGDENCAAWEPSMDDFLSSALMEAECMRRLLPREEFRTWLAQFLPELAAGRPSSLFNPALPSDRSDGKIAHLDGLNFSRAWCMRGIATVLDASDPARTRLLASAQQHIEASFPHITDDYAGEHWLATFALLAMDPLD